MAGNRGAELYRHRGMNKTTLLLISLIFALVAAACGSSDSETVQVTGGSGDQMAEAPASPEPDDEAGDSGQAGDADQTGDTPASSTSEGEGDEDSQTGNAAASPEPDDQVVEGPSNPEPDDQSGDSGVSSSSEADEDDRTSSASSSEDQTEDGPEDNADDTGAAASSGSSSTGGTADGTPSPDDAVSTSSDQAGTPAPTPSPTPVVPESDRRPVAVEDVLIVVRESWPMQVAVMISGSLPTPCHELRWTVEEGATTTEDGWTVAADGSVHEITVWTTDLPADTACATVMEPFEEQVELGRFVSGDFTIVVNGESFPLAL